MAGVWPILRYFLSKDFINVSRVDIPYCVQYVAKLFSTVKQQSQETNYPCKENTTSFLALFTPGVLYNGVGPQFTMQSFRVIISGVDPNTSNLDPDPEFWFNLAPNQLINFRIKIKNNLYQRNFLPKCLF